MGEGTINTRGLVTDIDLVFDQNHGLQQQLLLTSQPSQSIAINLDVDGTGSLGVGYRGQGSLLVKDGLDVSSVGGSLGAQLGSVGSATITGHGTTWKVGGLGVGWRGEGHLTISGGGDVSSSSASISGSNSSVMVTGNGSTWGVTDDNGFNPALQMFGLNSRLTVSNRGLISSTLSVVHDGVATVTGLGSRWDNTYDLYVGGSFFGGSGAGQIVVSENGILTVGGTLTVWEASNLTVDTGSTIDIDASLINEGHVDISSDSTLSAASITNRGTLTGSGKISTMVAFTNAGIIAPGSSPGSLDIDGAYSQHTSGSLVVEIGGNENGQFDVLNVSGVVSLAGTLDVRLVNIGAGAFMPKFGDVFRIVNSPGGISGRFDYLLPPAVGGIQWHVDYDATSVSLVVVPEPPSLSIVFVAILWPIFYMRCSRIASRRV